MSLLTRKVCEQCLLEREQPPDQKEEAEIQDEAEAVEPQQWEASQPEREQACWEDLAMQPPAPKNKNQKKQKNKRIN